MDSDWLFLLVLGWLFQADSNNLSEIVEIVRDELLLKNGETLYVGRAYRQEIKLRHLQFLKEQL